MQHYEGWVFQSWCALNPDDDRKIHYTLRGIWEGKKQQASFTSEDEVDCMMFYRIQHATIKKLALIENEWHVSLVY